MPPPAPKLTVVSASVEPFTLIVPAPPLTVRASSPPLIVTVLPEVMPDASILVLQKVGGMLVSPELSATVSDCLSAASRIVAVLPETV